MPPGKKDALLWGRRFHTLNRTSWLLCLLVVALAATAQDELTPQRSGVNSDNDEPLTFLFDSDTIRLDAINVGQAMITVSDLTTGELATLPVTVNPSDFVKVKAPNELGLYGMSGSLWEWCQDWFGPYVSESQVNPAGPESGTQHVIRGGCRGVLQPIYMRVSCHSSCDPDDATSGGVGLRLVQDETTPSAN